MSLFTSYDWTQDNLQLTVDTPFGEDYLLVRRFIAEESLSQPFRCLISMVSERLNLDPTEILGQEMTVTLEKPPQDDGLLGAAVGALLGGGPEDHYFHGICTAFRAGAAVVDTHGGDEAFQAYNAEFVPRFALLKYASNCRIFQEKSVVDIIKAVLEEHGFSSLDYSTSDVSGPLTSRKWDYCVQYNETDFQFLSRLMEEVGIYYYFEHTDSNHKLVLTDADSLSVKTHDMVFRTSSGAAVEPDEVTSWENRYLFRSGKLSLTDYDYRAESDTDLLNTETTSKGHAETKDFELYEYPVPYQTVSDKHGTKSDGGNISEIHLKVLDAQRHVVLGSSEQRELTPGHLIEMSDQQRGDDEEGDKFLLLSVRHEARQQPLPGSRSVQGSIVYGNSFTCIPSTTPYRQPRLTPRPRMAGPQTAIVIGAKAFSSSDRNDQEIMTDKFGRVKVQFPWDRRTASGEKKYENSSCWIRVSQGAAGSGWGMLNVPRKGEEVIVEFIDGDPNRPIITGRVYNGQNLTPYGLADSKPEIPLVTAQADRPYISGFKSCSGKDGKTDANYNELRFFDKKDSEHVYFHAEKDFVRVVENKDVLLVSDEKDITKSRIETALKDTKDGSQTIEVHKDQTITVQKGDQTLTVAEGKRITSIKMNDELEVTDGDRKGKISKGSDELEVTKGDQKITIKGGEHVLDVAKDITIKSSKNISIEGTNSTIELKIGQSSITMKNDGTITIKGSKITLDAMQKIDIKALQKVTIDGKLGVDITGLQIANKGQVKSSLEGAITEVKGSGMAKVQGAMTMIN